MKTLEMNILMVLTSNGKLGNSGKKTGSWLEEFSTPYCVFRDAGASIVVATPLGGQPPIDPRSDEARQQVPSISRFKADRAARQILRDTVTLASVKAAAFDAVFYVGGHGLMWDLVHNTDSINLIENMHADRKTIAAVCHGPAVLRHCRDAAGAPLVQGRRATGFANTEEAAVKLSRTVPFLVEDMLRESGARYSRASDWKPYAVTDGHLITGQNPASAEEVAYAVITQFAQRATTNLLRRF